MKIVITGAAGFLGQELVRQLSGKHELICLTRSLQADVLAGPGIEWLEMDLSKGLDVARLPEATDAIIHLAQSSAFRTFPEGAEDVFAINVRLPQELCSYALKSGVSRLVMASTGTVYEPFNGPMHEAAPLRPTGYYGASKLAAELISESYASHFSVANLRVFFLYGAGQKNMLIARLIDNVLAGNKVTLPADGEGLRFVPTHVSDCAAAFVDAVENGWTGPINIASPHVASLGDVLRSIATASGKELNLELTDQSSPTPIIPDLTKARELIDVERFQNIEKGIARTLS